MIYCYFTKNLSECTKKELGKQTGFVKLIMTGLKIMLSFRKICVCHL